MPGADTTKKEKKGANTWQFKVLRFDNLSGMKMNLRTRQLVLIMPYLIS